MRELLGGKVINIRHRSFGTHRSFVTLSLALAAALLAPAAPVSAQAPKSSSAPKVSFAEPGGPMIEIRAAGTGPCAYLWDGRATAQSDLIERAVTVAEDAVRRAGGADKVSAEDFPAANLVVGGDVPYRCVRTVLETIASAAFIEARIADPDPAADPWADALVFELYPFDGSDRPAGAIADRVGLSRRGAPTWDGEEIDLVKLRQYADLTQTMNPLPWLRLVFGEQAPFREVGPILGVLWRARVEQIEMSPPGGKPGLRLNAVSVAR
jgi:hypothetical protein